MLKSLAFLSPDEVQGYYSELTSTFDDDSKKIASWFDINYLNGKQKRLKS